MESFEEVERVEDTGVQLERVAKLFATEKPSTLLWSMGQTHHTVGTANVRASCMLLLATTSANRGPAPTSSAVMTMCRARPTLASIP